MTQPPAKGEFVTCENGHLICEVIGDIYYGEIGWTKKLGAWRIPEPAVGQVAPACECGAGWHKSRGGEEHIYIEGRGWV